MIKNRFLKLYPLGNFSISYYKGYFKHIYITFQVNLQFTMISFDSSNREDIDILGKYF